MLENLHPRPVLRHRGAKLLTAEQFPDTVESIISFKIDSNNVSLDEKEPLQMDAEVLNGSGGDDRGDVGKDLHMFVWSSIASSTLEGGIHVFRGGEYDDYGIDDFTFAELNPKAELKPTAMPPASAMTRLILIMVSRISSSSEFNHGRNLFAQYCKNSSGKNSQSLRRRSSVGGLALNVKTDLGKLKETMSSIKAVLLDAEQQQHRNEKLRLSSCSLPLSFSLTMGPKIKQINRRLNELATEWNSFDLGPSRRETHSFVNSSDVIGRDKDKENIIDHLKEPSEDGNIPVIPIVGIGGLGKTTLVQLVYNDDRITELFPLKLWICVSEDFDLPRLLKLMILSVNKEENCDGLTMDRVKRFIEINGWLVSKKIIVTTRSLKVASIMSFFHPYELTGLPCEDCLSLFTKLAFNDGDVRRHPNLMRIGEEIVKKCKGVPLAVFLKTDESYWISIRDNEIWRLEQSENDILPVLKLSYNHLPSHLQQSLPEGMDRLPELRELNIKRCPELSKRYRRDGGSDWHKIARVQEKGLWIAHHLTMEVARFAFNENDLRKLKETMSSSIKAVIDDLEREALHKQVANIDHRRQTG
ncbi:Leucine-rich repeat containing protein isoform 2 [Hibiscus syriacus]|uniref:Leucine-rich repeat containing protein isoform 2 n=1 Tax=Hibiscus syriacus TaxID=106335 RepID=A0A6A2YYW0_HIBSY|nr:Leucine-rich repeat containing protein isoform 2 [Hibiscus syriacus]